MRSLKYVVNRMKYYSNTDTTPFICFLQDHFLDKELVGVEVGVFKGSNASRLLRHLNIETLYLVDLYGEVTYYQGNVKDRTVDFSFAYKYAKHCLRRFEDKIEWLIDFSDNACGMIPSGVDFVYVDANHDFDMVYNDIKNYFPLVRDGGVFGGHDYCPTYPGVARAVDKFFGFPDMICNCNSNTEWWRIKNEN
jgi:hypothetical protein